ncbi:hypothetical protein LCGC14_3099970 [marine sediment metagenome]|uniref:Uncharacterized protein n=1 Tax=marine sediment metagenome TaxID=412755 RepID=A0A0F8WWY4_9ZZZZ
MPSTVVAMDPSTAVIAADRADAVVIPTSMTIDNQGGGGNRVISIQDVFTPSVSNLVSGPSETTVDRFRMRVDQGDMVTLGEEDLKGVRCLGKMEVTSKTTANVLTADSACYVTVGYKHE